MPDLLTMYAEAQPDKLAVVDDRPDGVVLRWTFAELEDAGQPARPTCCAISGRRARARRWCGAGRTRPGIVAVINAARKVGVTAVPLNYRLSAEEAAYVVDHCDAIIVYVDAEYAAASSTRSATSCRRCSTILVFGGAAPGGHAGRRTR